MSSLPTLAFNAIRAAFPALSLGYPFPDNASGSKCVAAHAVTGYLLNSNVDISADYSVSVNSTSCVSAEAEAAREFFKKGSTDEVTYGSSSTMLAENLARALG
uniref:Lipase ATG15 ) n=1 Tax=Ganoderma boninense TaxID=34458 RepID=A0A5K1JYD0_9APHY|nr:Putative lipase ATG15 (EC (Autophagy-related protein 15) [Ganoderma boninense]